MEGQRSTNSQAGRITAGAEYVRGRGGRNAPEAAGTLRAQVAADLQAEIDRRAPPAVQVRTLDAVLRGAEDTFTNLSQKEELTVKSHSDQSTGRSGPEAQGHIAGRAQSSEVGSPRNVNIGQCADLWRVSSSSKTAAASTVGRCVPTPYSPPVRCGVNVETGR